MAHTAIVRVTSQVGDTASVRQRVSQLALDKLILLTGGSGFLGQAVRRHARIHYEAPSSEDLDLMNADEVLSFFASNRPNVVVHLAARVGGIKANLAQPARFLIENVKMDTNVLSALSEFPPDHTIFMLSTCMYPDRLPDHLYPMAEWQIEDGPPPPTNASYAAAKRTLLHGARALRQESDLSYSALIPSNLFGPGDHFGSDSSHFLAAAVSRIEDARGNSEPEVEFFGTGRALRQFLLVDDLARLIDRFVESGPVNEAVNVAPSHNLSIRQLAQKVAEVVGYSGDIRFSGVGPDGQYRKDVSTERLTQLIPDWPDIETPLEKGLQETVKRYRDYVAVG